DPSVPNLYQQGSDRSRGNLLGVEPYMIPQDYASKESFFNKLNGCLLAAQRQKWLNKKTIVVFPEFIGTWLALAGEGDQIFRALTINAAERAMVLSNPLRFIANLLASREKGRAEAAFFRMKANQMVEIYQDVFSRLAQEYAVTIVAGSIVLPPLQISGRQLILTGGSLHNTCIVYQPDGMPYPKPILKNFPTAKELTFIAPAQVLDIPAFDTPAGRLGVLICADSWFPQAYVPLKEQGIDLLAVPSYGGFAVQTWDQPWPGYDGWGAPADVDLHDIKTITEGQAWNKYSLAGRIRSSGATHGMNVFLRGKLWDQDSGGWPATLVRDGVVFVEEQTQKAALLSLWL
ncbi:MAG TPA: nitrilase-related carbon-nitrogen hydrolase, partial [Anaerolineales bacterium]|nr:nitrilase-related carbon-nitrogen hydrolase [Anaerolineales bacterium]